MVSHVMETIYATGTMITSDQRILFKFTSKKNRHPSCWHREMNMCACKDCQNAIRAQTLKLKASLQPLTEEEKNELLNLAKSLTSTNE